MNTNCKMILGKCRLDVERNKWDIITVKYHAGIQWNLFISMNFQVDPTLNLIFNFQPFSRKRALLTSNLDTMS